MTSDPAPPTLPTAKLEQRGWRCAEDTVETVFSLPAMQVRGATVRYEDEQTRDELEEATDGDLDTASRFLAGTRLAFQPPLPLGVTPKMVEPTLRTEARTRYCDRLEERGLVGIDRDGSQQIRIDGGRARVTKFTATMPLERADLPLACWIAVWMPRSGPTVLTGAHPTCALADYFGLDTDREPLHRSGDDYREEFFELLRAVE